MGGFNFNPLMSEWANVSPALKGALATAGHALSQQSTPTTTATAAASAPPVLPSPGMLLPHPANGPEPGPIGMGSSTPSLSMPAPAPSAPKLVTGPDRGQAMMTSGQPVKMGTTLGDTVERSRLLDQGPGVDQIASRIEGSSFGQAHPFAGKLLGDTAQVAGKIGDTALNVGGALGVPALNTLARDIPGTTQRHNMLLGHANAALTQDEANAQKQAQTAAENATAQHTAAETPEVAPNAESERGLQGAQAEHLGAETENLKNPPANLAQAYAHAVNQAIKEGRDPAQDPIVGHLSDAITSLQKQPPDTRGIISDLKRGGQEHNVLINPATGEEIRDLGLRGERPATTNLNMVSPGDNSDLIKAIGEYRVAAPNPRTAQGAAILRAVAQAYPDYDSSQFEAQNRNRAYFTSGKGGAVINALNTVSQHLDDAEKNMPNNGSIPLINKVNNIAGTAMGEAPTKRWDVDADAIGGEWSKLVSGGVATEGELNHIKRLLDNADSPKAMRQAISEIRELTQGKLESIQQQMGSGALQVPARGISSLPGQSSGAQPARPASVPAGYNWNPQGNGGKGSWQPPK